MAFKCQLTLDVFQTQLRPDSFKSHPNLTGLNSLNVPGKYLVHFPQFVQLKKKTKLLIGKKHVLGPI